MSKQEDFYDILRSKFNEQEIPVNEGDWKNMKKTINDSRNKKKRIVWGFVSFAGLLLLSFGIYEFVSKPNISKDNNITGRGTSRTIAKNNTGASQDIHESASKNKETNTTETKATEEPTINKAVNSGEVVASPKAKNATLTVPPAKAISSQPISTVSMNEKSSTKNHTIEKADKGTMSTAKNTQAKNENVSAQLSTVNNIANNSSTQEEFSTSNKRPASSNLPESIRKDSTVNQDQPSNTAVTEALHKKDSAGKSAMQVVSTAPVPVTHPDSTGKKTDSAHHMDSQQQTASLPPLEEKPSGANNFSVELGAGYSFGWKYSDTVQGRGINPILGIGYSRTLGTKWAIKTGLQVNAQGDMSTSPLNIKHTTYDFSSNSSDTTVTTKWLVYLSIPLQVEYKLGQKNAIGIGGSASYLITGWGKVDAYSVTDNNSIGKENSYSQYMYVKGYAQWSASAFLLYKRTIFGNLSAYVIPYLGLTDIKNNTFFKQNTFERDYGVKFLLSYNIF